MMNKLFKLIIVIAVFISPILATAQNVAINRDGSIPDSSAMLDIAATDAGILIPRMTAAQKDGISGPATGLLIFQTDNSPGFYFYSGASWIGLSQSPGNFTLSLSESSLPFRAVDNTSYNEVASFIFRGTSNVGMLAAIKSVSYSEGAGA